jgi:hypothetical protein
MVPVALADTPQRLVQPLTLVAPSGLRIEGLAIGEAVDLLRRLAC